MRDNSTFVCDLCHARVKETRWERQVCMSEYDEMPRGDGPEFYLAEIVAQTNKRSLALAIRRELGEGYVITPGIDMLYAVRRLARSRKSGRRGR